MARKKKEDSQFNIDDYKDEIDKYIKKRVEKEASSEVVKIYKKQIKGLKIKNGIKNLVILILLAVIGYGSYMVYTGEKLTSDGKTIKNEESKVPVIKENEEDKKENLIDEYKYLLDKIVINSSFPYETDLSKGNLTEEIKEYIAFANLTKDDIENEDGTLVIGEDKMSSKVNELFTSNDEFKTFKYNDKIFTYLKNQKIFVGEEPDSFESIERNITDCKVKGNEITLISKEKYKDKEYTLKYIFVDGKLDRVEA